MGHLPDGGRDLHADEEERGVSFRPLVDTGEEERGVSFRPLVDTGEELSHEEAGVEREGNKRRRGDGGDNGEGEGDEGGMKRAGKKLRIHGGEAVEEGGILDEKNTEAAGSHRSQMVKEVQEAPKLAQIKTSFSHRRHQGLGSILQQLGCSPVFQTREEIKERVKILEQKQAFSIGTGTNIEDLPVAIIQDILMRFHGPGFWQVIASSFVFLRAAIGPCNCDAFRASTSFIGIIIQPHNGRPSVATPGRLEYDPLESVALMLKKFIALSLKADQWYTVVDSRGGHLLVSRDSRANRLGILKPTHAMIIEKLPLVPLEAQEQVITAAVLPTESSSFAVIVMSTSALHIIIRKYSSGSGLWSQRTIECPLLLSRPPESTNYPLYASNSLHLLNPARMRLLRLNLDNNTIDAIRLPLSADPLRHHRHLLARTRRGEVCWVVLDGWDINISLLDGVVWNRRWRWPVPRHFYTCRLIGVAESSHLVMLECLGEICCVDVEQGVTTYLKGAVSSDSCLSFEMGHSLLDHD